MSLNFMGLISSRYYKELFMFSTLQSLTLVFDVNLPFHFYSVIDCLESYLSSSSSLKPIAAILGNWFKMFDNFRFSKGINLQLATYPTFLKAHHQVLENLVIWEYVGSNPQQTPLQGTKARILAIEILAELIFWSQD